MLSCSTSPPNAHARALLQYFACSFLSSSSCLHREILHRISYALVLSSAAAVTVSHEPHRLEILLASSSRHLVCSVRPQPHCLVQILPPAFAQRHPRRSLYLMSARRRIVLFCRIARGACVCTETLGGYTAVLALFAYLFLHYMLHITHAPWLCVFLLN